MFLQLRAEKWESVCFQGNLFTVINVWWEFSDPFIPSAKVDLTGGVKPKGSSEENLHQPLIKELYIVYVLPVVLADC